MQITPEIKDRLEQLSSKYAAIGQDLVSYLDGLIFANPLTYWDYIEVDALLSLQKPKTDYPDEKIFIVYHQITELYFSLILHELDQICHNGKIISEMGQDLGWNETLDANFFVERLERVNLYFSTLTQSFEVMRFGMEKDQFTKFRMSLLSSSGFQTAAYRRIEIACTDLRHLVLEKERENLKNADIHKQLNNIYWRRGAIVEDTGEKALTLKDFEKKYLEEFHDFADKFQPINIWRKYTSLPKEDQRNAALIKELRALDVNVNVNWPLVHFRTAAHYLSKGTGDEKGTGGTNWQKYLPPRFQKRIFYPDLWSSDEKNEWGKKWVEEVLAESIKTGSAFKK
ncbi:MAG: tryptophan 2,3-dioxygenase [Cryomorphaceae bacterium]|nr:tryptophan 2,3-dioxygenase [Cryomorphaceae bacterium]